MACDDCARRDAEEFLDNLDHVERVQRNQGIALLIVMVVGAGILVRLNAKGVLTFAELLEGPAGG
jgi:hypothetical protein